MPFLNKKNVCKVNPPYTILKTNAAVNGHSNSNRINSTETEKSRVAEYERDKVLSEIKLPNLIEINKDKKIIDSGENHFDIGYRIFDNSAKMATVKDVLDGLRIPDAIKDLPTYEGNPRTLFDFIDNVEEILIALISVTNTGYKKIILRAIRNKITGQANEVLNMYGTPTDWNEIKQNLITHYADKRNETSLIRDLHLIKQGPETVENFYSKVIEILSVITNHIKIHEVVENVIIAKQNLYQEMSLNIFLSGLREPLGSTIRAMRPSSLAQALNYCLEEQNTHYIRYSQSSKVTSPPGKFVPQKQYSPNQSLHNNNSNIQPNRPNIINQTYRPNFNNQPFRPNFNNQNYRPNFNNPQPQFGNNYNNQVRNYPPNQFSVRPNISRNSDWNKPVPMDTSSGNKTITYRPQPNNYTRPNNPQKIVSEELFNLESEDKPQTPSFKSQPEHIQDLDNWYGQDQFFENEIDDSNFQYSASENQSDT